MALLDRLRPQPAWKHSDPAVRASAVEGLPDTEHAILAALARDDESPRVRRAALARLDDVEILGALAQRDADTQVRADAGGRLVMLACEPADEPRARRAAAAVTDDRLLAQIARTAPTSVVALSALDRLADTRALGTIARHGEHPDVRLRALGRLQEAAELVAIAVNTDHKDVGLAAVERLTDLAALNDIAERAKNKVVGKRARAIAREAEAREAEVRVAAESRARRHALLREAVEGLERLRDTSRGRAELERLTADWSQAGPAGADATARFTASVERVRQHFDGLDRDAAAAACEQAARDEARRARESLIDAAQRAEGPDTTVRLEELRAQWAALPALDEPEASTLSRSFAAAAARAAERVEARARAEAMQTEIAALITDVSAIVDEGELEANRPRFQDVQRRWKATVAHLALDRAQYDAFHAAELRWHAREEAVRAEITRTADEQRARLTELADRAAALDQRPDATIKDLDHVVRELRTAIDQAPPLPPELREALPSRLKALLTTLLPRLREQRETDDWRRWANAGIQEELVKRVETLRSATDLSDVARQLRDLRRQWKAVSAGRREEGDTLWQRFKTAADEVQSRCDEHFGKIVAEQTESLTRRQAICEQAEALAQSTDWIATADTLKRLQNEWTTIGPAPREQAGELARRFRVACDTFFTRRKTDLNERKHVWADNAHKKDALCVRAETVAESSDWAAAFNEIKQLQAEWRSVGPVRKNRSEVLWKRFRAACDRFFERYGKRHEIAQQHRLGDREALCQQLEALASPPAEPSLDGATPEAATTEAATPVADASQSLLATVDRLWHRWQESPGIAPEAFAALRARFDLALERVLSAHPAAFRGSRFDLEAAAARRDALCQEVETVGKDTSRVAVAGGSSAATLAALLKESLAANTIGGRVSDDSRVRAAGERVRRAQSAWRELGPMPGEAGRVLEARFQRACRRFFDEHPDQRPSHGPPHGAPRGHRPHRPRPHGPGPHPSGPTGDRRS